MGRYKLGPQGTYFDPNDSGPDQASPDQIQQYQQSQQPFDPSRGSEPGGIRGNFPTGGYQPPTGGINPGPNPSPTFPQFPGTPSPHTGPRMPMITPNPEFDAFYAQRKASGLTFPQIMDEWQAQHPQTPHILGGGLGQLPGQIFSGGQSGSPSLPSTYGGGFAGFGDRPLGGLQMLGPKALL